MEAVQALLQTYLFQDLSPAEVEGLAHLAVERNLVRGEDACRVGDPADELWIIVAGQFKEYRLDPDGNEYVNELMGPGQVFGEPGIFSSERNRVVNVTALEHSTVLTIHRDALFSFLIAHPPAMLRLLEGIASEARTARPEVTMMAYSSLSERVIAKLLQLAQWDETSKRDGVVELQISQSLLASMVGATREKVNRALAPLVEDGLVRLEYRRILLPDIQALRRLVPRDDLDTHPRHRRPRRAQG
ncbi:MAG TPA: Crp/Fnr family transcriptional regulator [Candidatus Dormibacteraeota bacterium]|nr:Crp/Fnr family transcriptional regulator [Candidatus Dormibacteraeota bacterium]